MTGPSNAEDYSCLQPPDTFSKDPTWVTSSSKDLKFVVSWSFKDPEKCIIGMSSDPVYGNNFKYPKSFGEFYQFPTKWTVTRDGEMALVSAEVEFPVSLLKAQTHLDNEKSWLNFFQTNNDFNVHGYLKIRNSSKYSDLSLNGEYGLAQLWGNWFSKNQEIFPTNCKPTNIQHDISRLNSKISWRILESGSNSKVEISLSNESNCIFLVHSGPLETFKSDTGFTSELNKTLAEYAFWDGQGSIYFSKILSNPDQLIQVALGDFTEEKPYKPTPGDGREIIKVLNFPDLSISHKDSISKNDEVVKVVTTINQDSLASTQIKNLTLYIGFYSWHLFGGANIPSGWNVSFTGNTWTARYSSGGGLRSGNQMVYQTRAIKIPVADLLTSPEAKAAAELKSKQEAEAKAAAELKAKQEAEAKVTADRLAAIKAAAEAEADAREAEIRAAEEEAKAKAAKKTTITCIKGKLIKKVTSVKPKCPSGYKKKS